VADRFITGAPKRISREAPVLILRHEREEFIPGGGANAVANVRALGGEPLPLGVVGDDESGRLLLEALTERGITTDGVTVRAGYRTPTKTRILGGGRHAIKQQIVRYDVEDRVQLDASDVDRLTRTLIGWGKRAAVAVLSDYGYGAVPPELSGALRGALADPGIVLADSRYRLDEFRGLDGATPNEEEAEALLGEPLSEEPAALRQSGRLLLDRLASRFLLITRGSQGMSLFLADGCLHLPVHGTDQVADVTGAGDTVIGAFALALAAGATPVEAALLANYAGGMVVMKTGTATLSTDELRDAVSSDHVTLEGSRWEKY
jgi:rfaE bifunctional protein kinase chain/domain